jgi:predicted glutamine amidotransferase
MCRWLADTGSPVFVDELILKPDHSLIEQSQSAASGATPTNGDGFSEDTRVVVSEPFGRLSGAWSEIPPSTAVTIAGGKLETRAFSPRDR